MAYKDRERKKEAARIYRERPENRAREKAWRAANAEHLREANRLWREAHPGAGREGMRRWIEKNPDRGQAQSRAGACNRRAKAAGIAGHITTADICALWGRQPACVHCGRGPGVDHVVAFCDGGLNIADNLQNLCRDCNMRKQATLRPDQVREMRRLYEGGLRHRPTLAARFGTSAGNVWLVVTHRTWRDV